MSRYADLRPEFFKALATGAVAERAVAQVPPDILERWTDKFYRVKRPSTVPMCPRLLNHFKLGADPEFAFLSDSGQQASANNYGLRAGLCFGADNNGRLVELRPKASSYAVEVVASILSELRWLAVCQPKTVGLTWKAGAYSGYDGLGGHVHFGRKRSKTSGVGHNPMPALLATEVAALDRINALLHVAGVFSEAERVARLGKKYGTQGDWRPQVHGYEYRSFPSWLTSPWTTYLTIVLSKLAVLNPEMVKAFPVTKGQSQLARKQIRSLLAYYKTLDDDALLAYLGLDVWGLQQFENCPIDFKPAWGIGPFYQSPAFVAPTVLPLSIAPSKSDIEEIYFHILQAKPIYNAQPSDAQWPFRQVPKGFEAFQRVLDTHLRPGLGELCWDLVKPKDLNFKVVFLSEGNDSYPNIPTIYASTDVLEVLPLLKGTVRAKSNWGGEFVVGFNKKALNAANLPFSKQWLLSNGLPVARWDQTEALKFENWQRKPFLKKPVGSITLFQGV